MAVCSILAPVHNLTNHGCFEIPNVAFESTEYAATCGGAYELASAVKAHGSSVLLFSSAWCNSHPDDDPKTITPVNRNEILTYWLNRLVPLVGSDVHFVCANRVGEENGITFTGWGGYTSSIQLTT